MQVIRKGMFETNSSSMHSVVIDGGDFDFSEHFDTITVNPENVQIDYSTSKVFKTPLEKAEALIAIYTDCLLIYDAYRSFTIQRKVAKLCKLIKKSFIQNGYAKKVIFAKNKNLHKYVYAYDFDQAYELCGIMDYVKDLQSITNILFGKYSCIIASWESGDVGDIFANNLKNTLKEKKCANQTTRLGLSEYWKIEN